MCIYMLVKKGRLRTLIVVGRMALRIVGAMSGCDMLAMPMVTALSESEVVINGLCHLGQLPVELDVVHRMRVHAELI